ncbi:hypothetical protein T03_4014 [Trichinella britovi]|uniref:Uncharacterized protein n=1 Tax=Trichinella britovi TaxID=45882 RepID=A0A0V1D843_TRIBR|nr:hypothetical protein T03_4014 [Trichinella britovi]
MHRRHATCFPKFTRQLNYYMIEELLQKPPLRKTAAECATYAALAVRSMTSENSAMLPESAMGKL